MRCSLWVFIVCYIYSSAISHNNLEQLVQEYEQSRVLSIDPQTRESIKKAFIEKYKIPILIVIGKAIFSKDPLEQARCPEIISTDGKYSVIIFYDGVIKIRKLDEADNEALLRLPGACRVLFSPDSKFLLVADKEGSMFIWDIIKEETVAKLRESIGEIYSLCWSTCGKYLLTSSADTTVRLWDIARQAGDVITHQECMAHVGFDATAKHVFIGSYSSLNGYYIDVYAIKSENFVLKEGHTVTGMPLAYTLNGISYVRQERLTYGSLATSIVMYNTKNRTDLGTIGTAALNSMPFALNTPLDFCLNGNEQYILANTGLALVVIDTLCNCFMRFSAQCDKIAISHTGRYVSILTKSAKASLWDLEEPLQEYTLEQLLEFLRQFRLAQR